LEQTKLPLIARKLKLTNYFRYVDDILIVFDSSHTDINTITKEFNSIHPKMQLTQELEREHKINYLDITIHRKPTHANISIFRKPTYTDTLIPYTSNHPTQRKYAAIRFLYNRLDSYQLQNKEYQREENIIHNILHNNGFPKHGHTHKRLHTQPLNQEPPATPHSIVPPKKWCTFTYFGKETLSLTKIFKHTDLHIAYLTNNTLQKHLSCNTTQVDKYTLSGIYRLTRPDCNRVYVGQTGCDFHTRYKEHLRAFQCNTQQSKFAQHLTKHGHTFGSINSTMEIMQLHRKSTHLNTLEKFYIHKEFVNNKHLNEEYADNNNQIG